MERLVIFSPEANEDLEALQTYLSDRFYPVRTAKYISRIHHKCMSLALAPFQGQSHEKYRPGLRSTGFEGRITILYRVTEDHILILGIYYGGRQPHLPHFA